MSIDKATVAKIATLARIKVSDAELEPLAKELQGILSWVEQLNELDTSAVEPMTSAVAVTLPERKDAVDDGACPDAILKNAPEAVRVGDGGFFVVPKVVE